MSCASAGNPSLLLISFSLLAELIGLPVITESPLFSYILLWRFRRDSNSQLRIWCPQPLPFGYESSEAGASTKKNRTPCALMPSGASISPVGRHVNLLRHYARCVHVTLLLWNRAPHRIRDASLIYTFCISLGALYTLLFGPYIPC